MIRNNLKFFFMLLLFSVNCLLFSQTDKIIQYGKIKGKTIFPSDANTISMKVCAVNTKDSTLKYSIETYAGKNYSLKVPVGLYYVYSYALTSDTLDRLSERGYYTDKVLCGLCYECGSRSVILKVNVKEGKTVSNINPFDFYWFELLIIKEDTIITIIK